MTDVPPPSGGHDSASRTDRLLADQVAGENDLVKSARAWCGSALDFWIEGEPQKTALLAPLAVELLAKAALWKTNPALLVPLTPESEASLFMLSTRPDLSSPILRTIGLAQALARLDRLLNDFPIDQKRRRRMCDVRNGAIHVGTTQDARHVLLDALAVLQKLLDHLEKDAFDFFGDHAGLVNDLLTARRSEVGERVAGKLARARGRLSRLEHDLGDEAFQAATDRLEQLAEYDLHADDYGSGLMGIRLDCPECRSVGRLFGDVDVDGEPDFEVEPLGHGEYESYVSGISWTATVTPSAFACNVCGLVLSGPDELAEAGLGIGRRDVELAELGDDFDPETYANQQYDPWQ